MERMCTVMRWSPGVSNLREKRSGHTCFVREKGRVVLWVLCRGWETTTRDGEVFPCFHPWAPWVRTERKRARRDLRRSCATTGHVESSVPDACARACVCVCRFGKMRRDPPSTFDVQPAILSGMSSRSHVPPWRRPSRCRWRPVRCTRCSRQVSAGRPSDGMHAWSPPNSPSSYRPPPPQHCTPPDDTHLQIHVERQVPPVVARPVQRGAVLAGLRHVHRVAVPVADVGVAASGSGVGGESSREREGAGLFPILSIRPGPCESRERRGEVFLFLSGRVKRTPTHPIMSSLISTFVPLLAHVSQQKLSCLWRACGVVHARTGV